MTDVKVLLSEKLLQKVEETARSQHRKTSEVLEEAIQQYLENLSWEKLLHYGQAHAAALQIQESDIDRLIAEFRNEQHSH